MAKGKSLQQSCAASSVLKALGVADDDHEDFIEYSALFLEGLGTIDALAIKFKITSANVLAAFSDAAVGLVLQNKQAELINSSVVTRKTAAKALYEARHRFGAYLGSDLNASSFVQIVNAAYRVSGMESADKKADKYASSGAIHVININLNSHGQGEPKTISVSAPVRNRQDIDDTTDGEIIEEENK